LPSESLLERQNFIANKFQWKTAAEIVERGARAVCIFFIPSNETNLPTSDNIEKNHLTEKSATIKVMFCNI